MILAPFGFCASGEKGPENLSAPVIAFSGVNTFERTTPGTYEGELVSLTFSWFEDGLDLGISTDEYVSSPGKTVSLQEIATSEGGVTRTFSNEISIPGIVAQPTFSNEDPNILVYETPGVWDPPVDIDATWGVNGEDTGVPAVIGEEIDGRTLPAGATDTITVIESYEGGALNESEPAVFNTLEVLTTEEAGMETTFSAQISETVFKDMSNESGTETTFSAQMAADDSSQEYIEEGEIVLGVTGSIT